MAGTGSATSEERFVVVREGEEFLVVGPLPGDAARVLARCPARRDAETIVLLLNVPFDELLGVVRAVAELGAEDDLSLVRIRASVEGLGASAARWLTRAESTTGAGDT